jgi:mono/diheme cytochrome c family protein
MKTFLAAIVLTLFSALLLAAAAQDPAPIPSPHQSPAPPLVIRSTYGADLYQFYCSTCHGPTAHGGPARPTQPPVPDLTALARRNDGVFPRDRIRDSITFGPGASLHGSHGTADMPVWGIVFRGLDQNDTMTAIRIENLVNYLASLQDREGGQ